MAPPGTGLLIAPTLAVLGLLAFHALRHRPRRTGVALLAAAFAFGALRGNFIAWFMTDAAARLGAGDDFGLMPYVVRAPLLRLGRATAFECAGWVIALYLGLSLAEDVLRRRPGMERRLFPLVALASVFTAALGYAVEAGANAMGWWTWTLPMQSRWLAEVPAAGVWAWFSVGVDFLLPFLLLAGTVPPAGRWRYLSLLVFPAHMASNLLDLVAAGRPAWLLLGEPSWHAHLLLLASAVGMAAWSRREVGPAVARRDGDRGIGAWLPAAAASLVLLVLWVALALGGRSDLWVATAPLLVFILLAVPSVPLWVVGLIAAVAAPLASWRGLAACVPLIAFAIVQVGRSEENRRPRRLLAAAGVAAFALVLGWQVAVRRAERAYFAEQLAGGDGEARRRLERLHPSETAWQLAAGHTFASLGRDRLAIEAYTAASRREPSLVPARNGLGLSLLRAGRSSEAVVELQAATRILPAAAPLRHNLGLALLADGRLDEARRAFEAAIALGPRDARPWIALARVADAGGRAADAMRILRRAEGERPDDAELQIALGALHQGSGNAATAELHLRRAMALDEESSEARCRLALLLADQPGRLDEARELARAAVALQRSDLTLDTLGVVLLRDGNVEEAREVLEEALALNRGGPMRQRISSHLQGAHADWLIRPGAPVSPR